MPTSTVARQLGVRYVLGGSARAQGDQIRVATELADAETGRVLWSQHFDALRTDVIKLQDEITRMLKILHIDQNRYLANGGALIQVKAGATLAARQLALSVAIESSLCGTPCRSRSA